MKRYLLSRWVWLGVLMFLLDQGTKYLAYWHLRPGDVRRVLIPGFIELQYAQNIGAAFSILPGKTTALIAIAVMTIVMIGVYISVSADEDGPFLRCGLTLILAGTVGNLVDRSTHGFVIDMFHFIFPGWETFPIFNVADVLIDTGVALLFVDFGLDLLKPRKIAPEEPEVRS